MTAQEFVDKVRNESPIIPDGYTNLCAYCRTPWAERTYEEYLTNPPGSIQHHEEDCLWVIAHEVEG